MSVTRVSFLILLSVSTMQCKSVKKIDDEKSGQEKGTDSQYGTSNGSTDAPVDGSSDSLAGTGAGGDTTLTPIDADKASTDSDTAHNTMPSDQGRDETGDSSDGSGANDTATPKDTADAKQDTASHTEEDIVEGVCEGPGDGIPFAPGYTPDQQIRDEAETLAAAMSVAEKATEMRGTDPAGGNNLGDIFRQPDNESAGIRGLRFRDGPRGLNLAAELQSGHDGYSTAFPVTMARAASFDLDLEYRVGKAHGDETLASRNTLLMAPSVNLLRHPAWGRAQESYGEDPYLAGRMGTAYTLGVQEYIPTCVKHFTAYNIENGRSSNNAVLDEQTLREIYSRSVEMIVKDAGPACIMAAYNAVNGTGATQNQHLLTDILRADFAFEGFVISDWWAMTNGSDASRISGEYVSAAAQALEAGLDMELPWGLNYGMLEAMVPDTVDELTLARSATRILEQKIRFNIAYISEVDMGLTEPTVRWNRDTSSIIENDYHMALAEETAQKGAVLLKNEQETLPISRTLSTIAVLAAPSTYSLWGEDDVVNHATDVVTGDLGSSRVLSDPAQSISLYEGIREIAGEQVNVIVGDSAQDAADADFVVVAAGLNPGDEGEEYTGAGDRNTFRLDGKIDGTPQDDLIQAAAALGKPMVVVLYGGSAIEMPWLAEVPAVLMAWYPGMVGGRAVAKLLFGDVTPGGKLPFTWPKSWDDEPTFIEDDDQPMDYFVGYRYFTHQGITPLFPFGHGLSYTTFEYQDLTLPCDCATSEGIVDVNVDITNTGSVAGDEVAYLFVAYPDSSDERRYTEQLKSFARVHLEPNETKTVTLPLRISDLRFYDMEKEAWVIETGTLELRVGPAHNDIRLIHDIAIE